MATVVRLALRPLLALVAAAGVLAVPLHTMGAGLAPERSALAQPDQTPPAGTTHVLTLADTNTTVTVAVGDSIQLTLGNDFEWQLQFSAPGILQTTPGPLPPGVQGSWVASSPGQLALTGQGEPLCRLTVPQCEPFVRVFAVTISVVPASPQSGQALATVHGHLVLSATQPTRGTSISSAGAGIPIVAVVAGDGTAPPVATTLTDDSGAFLLTLPAGSYWVFSPRAAADSIPRLSVGVPQHLPDGTEVVAWQSADLTSSPDITLTLTVVLAVP